MYDRPLSLCTVYLFSVSRTHTHVWVHYVSWHIWWRMVTFWFFFNVTRPTKTDPRSSSYIIIVATTTIIIINTVLNVVVIRCNRSKNCLVKYIPHDLRWRIKRWAVRTNGISGSDFPDGRHIIYVSACLYKRINMYVVFFRLTYETIKCITYRCAEET